MKHESKSMASVAVVVLNWNGKDQMKACLDSLLKQSEECTVIVVENGSTDGSLEYLKDNYPQVRLIVNQINLGFSGGANVGMREAIRSRCNYVAMLNNDAAADSNWLKNLLVSMTENDNVGIVTCKLTDAKSSHLDSTGDMYTVWGLPYPRGRGEPVSTKYDNETNILGASGGASLYRVKMLEEIGLFDEDFFAYYEDVDLSLRARLAGWQVHYAPNAVAYHQIGATSSKIKGFTTYQTIKNLPWLLIKNMPGELISVVLPRFLLAYSFFFGKAVLRGQGIVAFRGLIMSVRKLPKKWQERKIIQANKKVSPSDILEVMTLDLPPNAYNLRMLRQWWWKLRGKS